MRSSSSEHGSSAATCRLSPHSAATLPSPAHTCESDDTAWWGDNAMGPAVIEVTVRAQARLSNSACTGSHVKQCVHKLACQNVHAQAHLSKRACTGSLVK